MEDNQNITTGQTGENTALRLIETADKHLGLYELEQAKDGYEKALRLLSFGRENEEQTARALVSLGDCYYLKSDFRAAVREYSKACNLPLGYANSYALLRLGQVYYDMEYLSQAKHYLLQAYLIEGQDLFEYEDSKYYELIKDEELLSESAIDETIADRQTPKADWTDGIKRKLLLFFKRKNDESDPEKEETAAENNDSNESESKEE